MRLQSPSRKCAGVIEVYDNVVPNAREILDYLERRGSWEAPRIGEGDDGNGTVDLGTRNNAVTFFNPFDLTCPTLLRDFAAVVWHYLNDYATRHDVGFRGMEPVNVNRYGPGEYYHPHADAGAAHNREISALVYLNDVAEGGETEFVYHDVSVYPKEGRLVIFPSNYAYAHAARPPKSGVKYSVAFWTVR